MKRARWAWVGLAVYVLAADGVLVAQGHATMSTAFRSAVRHPVHRWPILAAWVVVTVHLFADLDHDPVRWVARRVRRT